MHLLQHAHGIHEPVQILISINTNPLPLDFQAIKKIIKKNLSTTTQISPDKFQNFNLSLVSIFPLLISHKSLLFVSHYALVTSLIIMLCGYLVNFG